MLKRVIVTLLILSLSVLLAACGGGDTATEAPPEEDTTSQEAEPTEVADTSESDSSETEEDTSETDTSEEDTQSEDGIAGFSSDERLLAWVAPASAPGEQGASAAGEVVYFDADGTTESILNLPNGTHRVTACGPNAEAPDGSVFAFMVTVKTGGSEPATLYLVKGTSSELTQIAGDLNPAACVGSAPLEFSPDSSHFAYIDWPEDATGMSSPHGRLRIYNTSDGNEVSNIENVTAFDLTDDGAAFVSFFVNNDGEATELDIYTWDGSSESKIAGLTADSENDCRYTSASINEANSSLVAIIGYKCNKGDNTSTQWLFYQIDAENGTAQLEESDNTGGQYFVFSDTNAILVSPDGNSVLFAIPDGVNNQSVSLMATALDNVNPSTVLDRFGLMNTVSDKPYDANNATAILSSDGRWFAIVVNDGNNNAELQVFDLNDVSLPPIVVDMTNQGDTVSAMVFARDNSSLYYVAGGDAGDNNSLFSLNLSTGAKDSNSSRGRYAQMAISPDGNALAIMNWVEFDDEEDPYLTLEIHDLEGNAVTVIYEGGEVNAENKLENASFAYPLSWRG